MRVLITGSRGWTNREFLWARLGSLLSRVQQGEVLTIVHGNAQGADRLAKDWVGMCQRVGHDVDQEVHPYLGEYGRAGGHIRNQAMVDAGADLVLAFILDNSPGATSLVDKARKAGLLIEEFHETTEVDMTEETTPAEVTPPTLVERLVAVKREIGAVGKADRNAQQGFNFRGIDAVLNAVAGPFMKHGIVVYPRLQALDKGTATTSGGKVMNTVVVEVEYVFTDGEDSIKVITPGEAFDSGDKCVAKAMSVAYRTALIQALSLPTDEPDPDMETYEAAPQVRQMSDDDLLTAINTETDVVRLQEMWPAQGLSARPAHLQAAVKTRAAFLRSQETQDAEPQDGEPSA